MDNNIPNGNFNPNDAFKNIKEDFKKYKSGEVEAVVKPEKVGVKLLISAIITAVVGGLFYYITLPVLSFKDFSFYKFIFVIILVFFGSFALLCKANSMIERREYIKRKAIIPISIVAVMAVVILVGFVTGATFFRASSYSKLMPVTNSDFDTDFEKISYDTVPRIDESRALTLADQQLGSLSEYKSQYVVSDDTTMINYKGHPVRVAYLEYADFFKWLNNTKDGLPAYMIIDLVSQKVNVVNCVEEFGAYIKYSPTELFNEKLVRHLRFQYPTEILDTSNFEIDDNGRPYWTTPVLDKTIGLFGGTDVKGVIITDALTGESKYHDISEVRSEEIEWIDVVYSERLLLEQYNYYGKLSNGFWNSIIFQNDVNQVSAGNGYIAMDDDVWVYTGVTSSKADLSNFGFILCNQRTKETRYYQNGGAMETSAMDSAKDAVQNYGYSSTFPILLDIEGQPTYFMSLYGDSNTVKGYALVNLDDKTIVGTGLVDNLKSDVKSLNAAVENYIESLQDKGVIGNNVNIDDYLVDETDSEDSEENVEKAVTVSGKVSSIKTSVNDGNTFYYLEIDGKYYYISVAKCMDVLLVNTGDTVTVTINKELNDTFIEATKVER